MPSSSSAPSPLRRRLHSFPLPFSWGRHKLLRCIKPDNNNSNLIPIPTPNNHDFSDLRSRLLFHYEVPDPNPPAGDTVPVGEGRPWNLRKRRAVAEGTPPPSSSPSPEKPSGDAEKKGPSIRLTDFEIEEDLARMCRGKLPRRPRRRGQRVQRVVDNLSPGECLCRMVEEWCRLPEEKKRR